MFFLTPQSLSHKCKTWPNSFPPKVGALLWAFKVKVTVSKNALKLRLFNRRTPFLTLTEGERNADKAPPGGGESSSSNLHLHSFPNVWTINETLVFRLGPRGRVFDTLKPHKMPPLSDHME